MVAVSPATTMATNIIANNQCDGFPGGLLQAG
jgi:hypothetical protein